MEHFSFQLIDATYIVLENKTQPIETFIFELGYSEHEKNTSLTTSRINDHNARAHKHRLSFGNCKTSITIRSHLLSCVVYGELWLDGGPANDLQLLFIDCFTTVV